MESKIERICLGCSQLSTEPVKKGVSSCCSHGYYLSIEELLERYKSRSGETLEAIRHHLAEFLDGIRDYEHENGDRICTDERETEEFVTMYLKSKAMIE